MRDMRWRGGSIFEVALMPGEFLVPSKVQVKRRDASDCFGGPRCRLLSLWQLVFAAEEHVDEIVNAG